MKSDTKCRCPPSFPHMFNIEITIQDSPKMPGLKYRSITTVHCLSYIVLFKSANPFVVCTLKNKHYFEALWVRILVLVRLC